MVQVRSRLDDTVVLVRVRLQKRKICDYFAIYLVIIFLIQSSLVREQERYLLSEEDVFLFQHLREHKRLLIVHVVVQSTVNQVVHLILDVLDLIEQLALLVALQIVGNGWQTHEPLGINRICN